MKNFAELKNLLLHYQERATDPAKKKKVEILLEKLNHLEKIEREDRLSEKIIEEIKNIKTPDYSESFEKLSEEISNIITAVKEIKFPDKISIDNFPEEKEIVIPKSVTIDNFPKQEKVEIPKEVKVSNFPKQKEYPKSITVSNLSDIKIPKKFVADGELPESIEVIRDSSERIQRTIYNYVDRTVTAIVLRNMSGSIKKITYVLSS